MKSYRTYKYTFGRPNETVRGLIRLYNDMNLSDKIIDQLMEEFNKINADNLPPKLGSTVAVPVLLNFCFRHENENEIFKDGK